MDKTNNFFIEALKYGRENMGKGISFNEMIKYLDGKGMVFDVSYISYMHLWFFTNFYDRNLTPYLRLGTEHSSDVIKEVVGGAYDNYKCLMTGEAFALLIEYESLQEARKSSKQANRLATLAIFISGGLALAQIILQLCNKS